MLQTSDSTVRAITEKLRPSLPRTARSHRVCDISAVDAALASSAAPTYFDEAVVDGAVAIERYLDRRHLANNPILPRNCGIRAALKISLDRIDV